MVSFEQGRPVGRTFCVAKFALSVLMYCTYTKFKYGYDLLPVYSFLQY